MTIEVVQRRVIAEWDGEQWLVVWPDGRVTGYLTPRAASRAINAEARKIADRTDKVIVDTVEWRNVPDGFEEPR